MTLAALTVLAGAAPALAAPASSASPAADAQAAAALATGQGYRTGIAVLDLRTGAYTGAGEDTTTFASESVVKVMIAAQLLLSGQMGGDVETAAYRMITASDDDAADALYGLAGGDDLIDELADHYGIPFLGEPPSEPGWWGNTKITAKGMVYLYAALAKDPAVGPWLTDAMAHASRYGADGTDQSFGLPSAGSGAAVKQGWGADGDDGIDAVFNSTGYVQDGAYAVAILTAGPASSYGEAISAVVTAEAQALLPGGTLDDGQDTTRTTAGTTGTTGTTAGSGGGGTQAASQAESGAALTASGRVRDAVTRLGLELAVGVALLVAVVVPWRRRGRLARHPRRP